MAHTLRELHTALDAKRRQVPWNKSVLAKVRSYCIEVARQAQSELPPSEDVASPSPELLEQDTLEMDTLEVPDPEFVVDVPTMEDEVVVVELSSGSHTGRTSTCRSTRKRQRRQKKKSSSTDDWTGGKKKKTTKSNPGTSSTPSSCHDRAFQAPHPRRFWCRGTGPHPGRLVRV